MRKYDTAFDRLRDAKVLTWRPWVLKPGKLLFVGSGVATNCKRKLLPGGVDAKINNHRKVGLGQTLQDGLGDGFREAARTVF